MCFSIYQHKAAQKGGYRSSNICYGKSYKLVLRNIKIKDDFSSEAIGQRSFQTHSVNNVQRRLVIFNTLLFMNKIGLTGMMIVGI